jgi:RHS repeat-associated protein
MMTNAANTTIAWQARYDPFGASVTVTASPVNNQRLPGQWFQLEDGLAYNWHRTYDPSLGRYTQPDPLGFVDGPSVYAYAGSNPLVGVDPTGQFLPLAILGGALGGMAINYAIELYCGDFDIANVHWGNVALGGIGGAGGGAAGLIAGRHYGPALTAISGRLGPIAGKLIAGLRGKTGPAVGGAGPRVPNGSPGIYANPRGGVPLARPNKRLSPSEQAQVNLDGSRFGCHSCGSRSPGTRSGNWIGDHQLPKSQNLSGNSQSAYPHCATCSSKQGAHLRWKK